MGFNDLSRRQASYRALGLALSVSTLCLMTSAKAQEKMFDWEIQKAIPFTQPAEAVLPAPPPQAQMPTDIPAPVQTAEPKVPEPPKEAPQLATPTPDAKPPVQVAEPPAAPVQPVAEAPAPTLDPFAAALSDRLKAETLKALFPDSKDREGILGFYADRQFSPVWTDAKGLNARAEQAISRMKASADDGLDPTAFLLNIAATDSAEKLADAELRTTRAVLAFARQATGGRTRPRSIHGLITVDPPKMDAAVILASSAKGDIAATLDGFNPAHPGFLRLKAKLADIRRNGAVATPAERRLESDLIANMERWRWLPRDLGESHVLVNIPDYEVSIYSKGARIHKTRVVVGKPSNQTPVFSNEFQFVVVNPSWYVPVSIQRKEMSSDPAVLAKKGFQVVYGRERVVDANGRVRYVQVRSVRQPPGERNALGRVKFMFPNQHSVYLHDTPSRHLFAQEKRAFSHGCVRVHLPDQFGEQLMRLGLPGENWTAERLTSLYGKSERRIDLKQRVPVHIAYFTLTIDENGVMTQRDDIYGHHAKVRAALGSEEKVATIR